MKLSCTSPSNSFGRLAITFDSRFVALARNSTSVEINANPRFSTNVEMSVFLDSMSVNSKFRTNVTDDFHLWS